MHYWNLMVATQVCVWSCGLAGLYFYGLWGYFSGITIGLVFACFACAALNKRYFRKRDREFKEKVNRSLDPNPIEAMVLENSISYPFSPEELDDWQLDNEIYSSEGLACLLGMGHDFNEKTYARLDALYKERDLRVNEE
jgi:hypothetical protein